MFMTKTIKQQETTNNIKQTQIRKNKKRRTKRKRASIFDKNEKPNDQNKKQKIEKKVNENTIGVYGLSFETTEEKVKDEFSKFGKILEMYKTKTYALITFDNHKACEDAIQAMNGIEFDGRKILVEEKMQPNPRMIFIRNLAFKTTEETLRQVFENFGNIISVKIQIRPDGKSSGMAHIEYEKEEEAQEAVKSMHNTELDGRKLRLKIYN